MKPSTGIKIKQCILILLLIMCAILAYKNKERFYAIREYYAENFFESSYDLGSQPSTIVEQTFVAKQEQLKTVHVRFDIQSLVDLKGTLELAIVAQDDTVVSKRTLYLSDLTQTETTQWTEFTIPCTLKKGEVYTLRMTTSNVSLSGDAHIYLCLSKNRGFLFKKLTIDGTENNNRLVTTFKFNTYCSSDLAAMYVMLILTGLLVLLLGSEQKCRKMRDTLNRIPKVEITEGTSTASRILFVLTPLVAFYMMQVFSGYGPDTFFFLLFSVRGLINIILYGFLLLVAYALINRTKYAALLVLVITYVCGLANYFVWNFRECPIVAADLASIGTAMNVADGYEYTMDMWAVWATVILLCYGCLLLMIRTQKGLPWKKRVILVLADVMLTTGLWGIFFKSNLMKNLDITVSVWMPQRDYATNGSALSFLLTWTYFIVEKPSGYSAEHAAELADGYTSDSLSEESDAEVTPNIICIMNESFSDLAVDRRIETTEDYMPFIHNLTENTVKGNLYVSVLGGNTANSEFEFLTGNSLAFFPSRSIPYNSYVTTETGSLTWTLKSQGYTNNSAVHPYYSDGWNREVVYPLLGFDQFLSQTDFASKEYVRDFVSDQTDYEKLIELYNQSKSESDDPVYLFSVTMQNHGGYLGTHGLVDENIQVTDPANPNDQLVQYMNLMKESDTAFENLVNYFKTVDEPTVIVMFGDHQPGFTDSVYDSLFGQSTSSLGIEDTMKMYQTPYLIWANYDIEEETVDMSANYLSSYLLSITGSKMTGYNKYLLDLQKKLPVISAIGYIGDNGVVHSIDEESEYSELIEEYQTIQYNGMFDTDNRMEDFFFLKE